MGRKEESNLNHELLTNNLIYLRIHICSFCTVFFILFGPFLQFLTMILQCLRIIVGDADFEPAGPLPQKSGALPVTHHISYRPQTKRPTTAGSTGQGTNLENTSKTNSFVLVCFLTSTLCKAGGHSCYHSHQ